ncbi:hypothetical protein [Plantactinospora sp. KLBMP9567]|uniref:hypothetical protein n=1 Tax=Plantactinospora sp. KLBMP9567 TaxID=3085900 RepID=UPI002980C5EA|nr:hypothetical protein [Plantactinospora sp. KLBMP9567]MDW5324252.1 hypothetical protein [Plantactinospora sp. KLBMP9567]
MPLMVAALGAALGLSPAQASAEPNGASGAVVVQEMSMKRVGVNREIAAAHGYQVRVDSNGVEYSVKKGESTLFDEVPGECGRSFIYLTAVDTTRHYTSIYTGFSLNPGWSGAILVTWGISIIDSYGASTGNWNDPAASVHFWAKTYPFTAGGPTQVTTSVLYGSNAVLWDGTICFSYGPTATGTL